MASAPVVQMPSLGEVQALRRELETHQRRVLGHIRWMQSAMNDRLSLIRDLFIASATAVEGTGQPEARQSPASLSAVATQHNTSQPDASRASTPVAHPETLSEVPVGSLFKRLPGASSSMQRWSFDAVVRVNPVGATYVPLPDEVKAAPADGNSPSKYPVGGTRFPLAGTPEALTMASFLSSLGEGFTLSTNSRVAGFVDGRAMTEPAAVGSLVSSAPPPPRAKALHGTPMASLIATKRGTVYLVENARAWMEPGTLVRLAAVASDFPDQRAHDIGLVIFTVCGGSAGPWGVGLKGAAVPRTIVADHYMLAAPSVDADALLAEAWVAPRTAESKAASVANAIALRHRRPLVFTDADWSVDRRQLILTYTTSAVRCNASAMARDINAALRVHAILRSMPDSGCIEVQH